MYIEAEEAGSRIDAEADVLIVTRCRAKVEEGENKEELAKSGGTLLEQLDVVDQDLLDLGETLSKEDVFEIPDPVPDGSPIREEYLESRRMIL